MEWKVYGSRKDYQEDDAGTRGKHLRSESGEFSSDAPQGAWAKLAGELVYVRKRPGKGKPFYYRVLGESAPKDRKPKPKPKPKPKHMEPLFDLESA